MGLQITAMILSALGLTLGAITICFVQPMWRKAGKIDTLEADLRKATEQAIKIELSAATTELKMRVGSVEHRLASGDDHLKRLDDGLLDAAKSDHKLQLEVLKAIGELKEQVATKEDLRNLREELRS